MKQKDLFKLALGLEDPWMVREVRFSPEEGRLDVWLDFKRGATFPCPSCGEGGKKAYDTCEKTWRHLNFFEHLTFLHARLPRVECATCGVKTAEVPWARPGSGFTLLFEAYLLLLASEMPVSAISRLTGEHDTRIWRVVEHWVERARSGLDLSSLTEVGMDETSSSRGHRYVTVFLDLDPQGRSVVYACPGKDAETIASFSCELKERGGDPSSVKRFCCDMSPAYLAGIRENFPEAEIVYDRFHLKQAVSRAVDEVRRAEGKERKELRGTRYLWLKRPENLKEGKRLALEVLLSSGLKTAKAYQLSRSFDSFFEVEEELAEEYLYRWFWRATHSRLEPMRRAAHTIRNHWEGVLAWHRHKVSTGVLEAINGLIQAAKRRARGYRNVRYLITMIYLIAGKLDFEGLPLPVLCVTHRK